MQQNEMELHMFSNAMNILDRVTMTFVVILAASPILAIAANAAFL